MSGAVPFIGPALSIASTFLGKKSAPPPPPPVPVVAEEPPTAPVPDADTSAAIEARRKEVARHAARRGRASTFLSQEDDKLGGSA